MGGFVRTRRLNNPWSMMNEAWKGGTDGEGFVQGWVHHLPSLVCTDRDSNFKGKQRPSVAIDGRKTDKVPTVMSKITMIGRCLQ